ncbi:unnamed protein product [Camellia sinensis]
MTLEVTALSLSLCSKIRRFRQFYSTIRSLTQSTDRSPKSPKFPKFKSHRVAFLSIQIQNFFLSVKKMNNSSPYMEGLPTTSSSSSSSSSTKSERRWKSRSFQTSKPSIVMAFFSSLAWLYVAGRLWQDAENRTLLANLLRKNADQRPKVLTVEDKLMVLGCKDLERRIVETEMELTLAKSQGYLKTQLQQSGSSSGKRLLAVIGVYTGFGSRLKRNGFRGSWMPKGDALRKLEERGVVIRFVIGRSANRGDSLDRNIDKENGLTKDFLILEGHEEAEEELPKKVKFFFSTAIQNWDADFYVKVDDNIALDLDGLVELLESRRGQDSAYIGCMKSGDVITEDVCQGRIGCTTWYFDAWRHKPGVGFLSRLKIRAGAWELLFLGGHIYMYIAPQGGQRLLLPFVLGTHSFFEMVWGTQILLGMEKLLLRFLTPVRALKGKPWYEPDWWKFGDEKSVLKDESTLVENKVSEDGFLVVMLSKSKTLGSSGTSSTQPGSTTQPISNPTSAPEAPVQAPAPEITSSGSNVATANAPSDTYGQAASILVAGSNLEQTIQQLMDIGGGNWDKEIVTRALQAAYNNPERAVDYLYSGIPEAAEVAVPVAHLPVNQATSEGYININSVSLKMYAHDDISVGSWMMGLRATYTDDSRLCCSNSRQVIKFVLWLDQRRLLHCHHKPGYCIWTVRMIFAGI